MAETTTIRAMQDVTVTFSDDTGTPKTYTFKLTEGTITIEDGSHNLMVATDAQGVPLSGAAPRAAGVASFCGFTISGKLFDTGANSTEGVYIDLIRNDGYAGSTWTPTMTSPDADLMVGGIWDCTITVANIGTEKGCTYLFPDVRKEGGAKIEGSRDGGLMVNGDTWRSQTTVHYTATRLT